MLAARCSASAHSRAASAASRSRKMDSGRMLSGGSFEYTSSYARFQSSYVAAASHACTLGSNASPAAKGRPLAGVKRLARSQRAPASALRGELEELRKHVAHVLRNAHGRDGARHRHLQVA